MSLLVTVVTPCFNSGQFLEATILSILNQTYANIEYIVIDGGSTDNTLEILNRYKDRIQFVSEPDNGQADAINKGWRMASGDVLAWLNADDFYYPDTVAQAVSFLEANPDTAWVYGYPEIFDADGNPFPFRHPIAEWNYEQLLKRHNYICQPTVFLRRDVIEGMGLLDEALFYMMDHEYWLRIGRRYPGHLVPGIRVGVKWYAQTKTASGGVARLQELENVLQLYGQDDLPTGMHFEWEEAQFQALARSLGKRDWAAAGQALRALRRYPRQLPRGLVKFLANSLIPPRLETRLRQWLLREQRYPD